MFCQNKTERPLASYSIFIIFLLNISLVYADELPLTGATEYSVRTPETYGLAWAFSDDEVFPEQGVINHNAAVAVDYIGIASYSVLNGIRSDVFQVDQSGPYRLRITGLIDMNIIEGSSSSLYGVSKSGGTMMRGGGLTTASVTDTLYQTDFSIWAYLYESAWAAIMVVINRWLGGSGTVSEILTEIRNQLEPTINWTNRSFSLDSYDSLECGIDYRWTFWMGSAVGAAGVGNIHETALFEAYVRDLHVELEYMGDPIYDIYAWCGGNGGVYPFGNIIIPQGEDVEFTAYPEHAYEVRNWYLDGEIDQVGGETYILANIQASHNVFVNFRPIDNRVITVVVPNGGEPWFRGRTAHIAWDFEGNVGEYVKIDLYKGGNYETPIIDETYNDGSYPWFIPHGQTEGTDYQVKIASLDNSVSDMSDGYFSIIEPVEVDTVRIYTVQQLEMVSTGGAYPRNSHYLLMNDIDAGEISNFDPIGHGYQHYFRGTFDGQGFTVSDLQIDRPTEEYIGLFSVLMDNGLIMNLTVADDGIYGHNSVGALVGECAGTVINCHALIDDLEGRKDPNGRGGNRIGGLVGENTGTGVILNCSVSSLSGGDVETEGNSPDGIGGLAGENSGRIEWCWSDVRVDAWSYSNNIYGKEVGGLVGTNYGSIEECYASGNSTQGQYKVGGIVGLHAAGNILNCYYSGDNVDADGHAGGIAGQTDGGTIGRCLSNGYIEANSCKGAVVGTHSGADSNSFWNRDVTGPPDQHHGCGGGIVYNCWSKTSAELLLKETYTTLHNTNWDFENVWAIQDSSSFPQLRGVGDMLLPPSDLIASTDESDGIYLSWSHVTYDMVGGPYNGVYRVFRSEFDDVFPPETELTDGWQTEITFLDSMALPEVSYYYSVKAAATVNGARESNFGNYVCGQRAYPPLFRPTGVSASDGLPNSILIEWNAVPDANFYRVFRSDSITGTPIALAEWQAEIAFDDAPPNPDTLYYYWVKAAVDNSGGRESDYGGPDEGYYVEDPTAIDGSDKPLIPDVFSLSQNYPNPFNSQSTIKYGLPKSAHVVIRIYNILGRQVVTLVDAVQPAGYKSVVWNAADKASGIYFYKIQAGDFIETKKMLLLK